MRNQTIRDLRDDLIEFKSTVENLEASRVYSRSLVAKIEDLEAALEKAREDKRNLLGKYLDVEKELTALRLENSRLSQKGDELSYLMQSS